MIDKIARYPNKASSSLTDEKSKKNERGYIMGKRSTIATDIISQGKQSFLSKLIEGIQWRCGSFAKRQLIIDKRIESLYNIIDTQYAQKGLGNIAKTLLSNKSKMRIPTDSDIAWVCEIVEMLEKEADSTLISIENYFSLLQFLRVFTEDAQKEDIQKACKEYTKQYPEVLLIPVEELDAMLLTTSLYYPEMDSDSVVQSVCGVIKLAVRFAELAKKDASWEIALRKELCQIHSLNIHICLLLEDAELLYFIEEAQSDVPEDLIAIVIQQLTLEEVYRRHGEESMIFSKSSTLLPLLSRSVYYGKYSPIFTLYNYLEFCKSEYKTFFELPMHYFIEILSLNTNITQAQSFAELSHALTITEEVVLLFLSEYKVSNLVSQKQRAILQEYLMMTREERVYHKEQIKDEVITNTPNNIQKYSNIKLYPECNIIFSYIETIIGREEIEDIDIPKIDKEQYSLEYNIHYNEDAFSLLFFIMEKKGILNKGDDVEGLIQDIKNIGGSFLTLPHSIYYKILSDTIKKHHSFEDISNIISYYTKVVDIVIQEQCYTRLARRQKEEARDEGYSYPLYESVQIVPTIPYEYCSQEVQ